MTVETLDYLKAVERMVKRAGVRVAMDGDEVELHRLLGMQAVLDAAVQTAVDGQLSRPGGSWTRIAWATGKTRQAAQMRWGRNRKA